MNRSRPSRTAIYVHCFSEKSSGVLKITTPTKNGVEIARVTLTHYSEAGDETLRTLDYDARTNLEGCATCVEGVLSKYAGASAAVLYLLDEDGEQGHDMGRWSLDRKEWPESERGMTMHEKVRRMLRALLVV